MDDYVNDCYRDENNPRALGPCPYNGKVDVVSWLLTLATWDGLLPATIILIPTVLLFVLFRCLPPGAVPPIVGEIIGGSYGAAVCIGVICRVKVGSRRIASNRCGVVFRRVQFAFLSFGVLVLAIFDLLLMFIEMGAMVTREDYIISGIIAAVLASIYLTSMAIPMYPGRRKTMTLAVCFRCGEIKFGAFSICQKCGQEPRTEDDRIISLAMSEPHFDMAALKQISAETKANGQPPELEPESREQIRKFLRECESMP